MADPEFFNGGWRGGGGKFSEVLALSVWANRSIKQCKPRSAAASELTLFTIHPLILDSHS